MRYGIRFITQVHPKNFFVALLSSRSGQVFQGATCRGYRNAPLNHPPFFYLRNGRGSDARPAQFHRAPLSFGAVAVAAKTDSQCQTTRRRKYPGFWVAVVIHQHEQRGRFTFHGRRLQCHPSEDRSVHHQRHGCAKDREASIPRDY